MCFPIGSHRLYVLKMFPYTTQKRCSCFENKFWGGRLIPLYSSEVPPQQTGSAMCFYHSSLAARVHKNWFQVAPTSSVFVNVFEETQKCKPIKPVFSFLPLFCLQQRVKWHHISVSSGGLHGWYDADASQCQLAYSLHYLGRRPERLPVCRRDTRHCEGVCLSHCQHNNIKILSVFLLVFFFYIFLPFCPLESRCSKNIHIHRLHGGDLLG